MRSRCPWRWPAIRALAMLLLLAAWSSPALANTVVRVHTVLGSFDVELFDRTTPLTVQNFLAYAAGGDWDGTFFHRSAPGFVVQLGGFTIDGGSALRVPTDPPVPNEFQLSNLRGTLAMAKLEGDPDSATSQWFVNLADNSANLDTQNGGFTVFGRVLGDGMDVVDAIAALPIVNQGGAFTSLPLRDWMPGDPFDVNDHLVFVNTMPVSTCEAGQRAAAAKLCKAELACLAKFSAKPEKDPTLAALDACRDKARAKFVSSYRKAIAAAAKKGRFCAADDPAAADGIADAAISTPATDLAEDVLGVDLASWTSADKIDKALRGGLLKAAASYCGKDLAILGGTAKKPNREKPAAARARAREKFDASAAKITAKAASKGVVYPGRPPAELGDEIEQLADDFADAPSQP